MLSVPPDLAAAVDVAGAVAEPLAEAEALPAEVAVYVIYSV
jgi:hypothetical protein